jgi:hypothetical protein
LVHLFISRTCDPQVIKEIGEKLKKSDQSYLIITVPAFQYLFSAYITTVHYFYTSLDLFNNPVGCPASHAISRHEPAVHGSHDNRDFCVTDGTKIHKCNRLLGQRFIVFKMDAHKKEL